MRRLEDSIFLEPIEETEPKEKPEKPPIRLRMKTNFLNPIFVYSIPGLFEPGKVYEFPRSEQKRTVKQLLETNEFEEVDRNAKKSRR